MKKIFSLFAAVLFAFAANAATTEVAPGKNALKTAVAAASAGDVLVLADGIYYEEGNFDMKKNLTIKAADGAKPVIANRYYFKVEGGADITFQGLKFDGASWRDGDADPLGASDYCMRSYSNSTGEEDVTFVDCEFTGYPSYIFYTQRADRKWNSITIRGCFFYNNARSAVYINNESGTSQSCNALTIENSTFANFSGSYDVIYYNAPAEEHTTTLNVDHCTFYGHPKRAIYWQMSENLSVSNCIFAQSASVSYKSVECLSGTISNCLSYNSAGYSSAATATNNIVEDPLFKDAANNDFTLGEGSPALTLNDGQPVGDPRWVPAPAAKTTLYCKMTQSWWTVDGAAVGIYAWDGGGNPKVTWPGERMTPVEGEEGVWSFELDTDTYKNCIFTRVNGNGAVSDWGAKTKDLTIPTDGKNLFTITSSSAVWGDPGCDGEWSVYGEAPLSAVPTEAAPVPTWPADQVVSIYSDTYTFAPASLNSYNESWWDNPTLTKETIGENEYLHYNGRMTGMIGWQFGNISATIMEYIHVDIWPSADATIKMGPTTPYSPNNAVASVSLAVKAGKWNSIDIPVADLLAANANFSLADIFQNQFTDYSALTDLSVDNVFFYRTTPYVDNTAPAGVTASLNAASYFGGSIKASATDESGAVAFTVKNGDAVVGTGNGASGAEVIINVAGLLPGTKYNLSVIAADGSGNAAEAVAVELNTLAGPAPATAPKTYAGLVKSLFSDVYPIAVANMNYYQEWWKGAPMSQGQLAEGDNVIFYGVADEGASFGWAFDQIDLTEYPYLHVSIYPLAAGTIEIYPVQPGSNESLYHRVSETLKANEWNDLVYDFTGLEMTKIQQIGWCNYVTAQGFFVDNFYFSKSKDEVTAADRRINAYGLSVAADGDNYVFSYTANIDGTEANIVFYQNGIEKDAVAIAAPKKGLNQATIAKSDIPKGSNTWAVELKADQVFEFGKLAEGANLKKCHLAIDNSPESDFFGRMYVANRAGSADGGIYVYNQDYTVNTENTLAGQPKWQSMGRPSVGADGTVYIGDWGDAHGGVYVMNPSTLTATCLFEGEQDATGVWTNNGVALGSSTASVGVYGEGANTVLYAMNEDVSSAGTTLYKHGVNVYQLGQNDGTILSKWTVAPTKTFALSDNAAEMFVINATSKGAFFSCSRAKPNNAAGARSLQFYNTNGERTFVALPEGETADLTGSLGGGCAVSRDEDLLAIVDGDGNILVYSIAWTNDVPALTKVTKYETAFAALGSLCFDYAGNIVVTAGTNYNNSTANKLVAYGVPTENNEVIVPAKKALVVEGTNEITAIEDTFVPTKVVKFIENGQLFIERDGKVYTITGTVVR